MPSFYTNPTKYLWEVLIADSCDIIDQEDVYDDFLDECYSFESVGGVFTYMNPSTVMAECDSVAYEQGKDEYFGDSETFIFSPDEVDCFYKDDVEFFLRSLVTEIESDENHLGDLYQDTYTTHQFTYDQLLAEINKILEDF